MILSSSESSSVLEVVANQVFCGSGGNIPHGCKVGNDECTEIKIKFQHSRNASGFVTTPNLDRTGLNLSAANRAVVLPKCWVMNKLRQAFARDVRVGQNAVPHTW